MDTAQAIEVRPINTEPVQEETKQAIVVLDKAKAVVIKSQQDYDGAGALLQEVARRQKIVEVEYKTISVPLNIARKALTALFKPPREYLAQAKTLLSDGRAGYEEEQKRIERAAQAKLDAEARKKKEALEKRAKAAEAKGKPEKAELLREEKEITVATVAAPRVQKTEGISATYYSYSAVVINEDLLPRKFMMPDQTALNKEAEVTKEAFNVPGASGRKKSVTPVRS